jgi:hypothetical protein
MMTSPNLENLVKSGQLKREEGDQREFDGMVRSARARLIDARKHALSIESRFDLAYNSAHALSLAALRWHGYRSDNRYLVFQCLPHTLGLGPEVWRVLALCHQRRNRGEYEGFLEVDEQLVNDLIEAAGVLDAAVAELRPLQ